MVTKSGCTLFASFVVMEVADSDYTEVYLYKSTMTDNSQDCNGGI